MWKRGVVLLAGLQLTGCATPFERMWQGLATCEFTDLYVDETGRAANLQLANYTPYKVSDGFAWYKVHEELHGLPVVGFIVPASSFEVHALFVDTPIANARRLTHNAYGSEFSDEQQRLTSVSNSLDATKGELAQKAAQSTVTAQGERLAVAEQRITANSDANSAMAAQVSGLKAQLEQDDKTLQANITDVARVSADADQVLALRVSGVETRTDTAEGKIRVLEEVVEDAGQVGLGEPAMHGSVAERPVDLAGVEQLGQLDRGGHLDPHLGGTGGGCFGEPQAGSLTQGEEVGLTGVLRSWGPVQGGGRQVGEVLVVQLRGPGGRPRVAGDLDRARVGEVADHDLLIRAAAVDPDPDRFPAEPVRDGVLAVFEVHHRRVVRHHPRGPERDRERRPGHRMQPWAFLGQHLDRGPAGDPMRATVHQVAERLAGCFEVGERVIGVAQVRLRGHQVGLRELHR